jgi:CBS domain containing-hemolysin-like protein
MLLGEILAPELMVPIEKAEAIDESAPVRDFLELARNSDVWRVLLRSPDGKIRGMANLYDAMAAKPDEPTSVIRRSVTHVRLDETVARVLVRMQAARQQLAVVVDADLNPLGRITVGDLVGVITRSDWKRPTAPKGPPASAAGAVPGGAEVRAWSPGGPQGKA